MPGPFDIFNRQTYALRRVTSPTSGNFDPATDIWQGPTLVAPATVQGHIAVAIRGDAESKWGQSPMGVIEKGSVRFFTETNLQKGDIIQADQEAGVVTQYRVVTLVRANRFMARFLNAPARFEFEIEEVPR